MFGDIKPTRCTASFQTARTPVSPIAPDVEPLKKAVNDAKAMGATLRGLRFDVVEALNVGRRNFNRSILKFTSRLEKGDEALVFYAGHGIEISGQNYLLPVDVPEAKSGQEQFIRGEAILADSIIERMRDQGLISRVLVTCPFTAMGTRFYREPTPESLCVLRRYNATMAERLALEYPLREKSRNELRPRTLRFDSEAKREWLKFADHIERLLAPGQPLEPISGFAAKMPEHAARIAAVLTWWRDHLATDIKPDVLIRAIDVVQHYANEALRLFLAGGVDREIDDAQCLLDWLHTRWTETHVCLTDIVQNGPNKIRDSKRARKLIGVLVTHRWLRPIDGPIFIRRKRRREAWFILERA